MSQDARPRFDRIVGAVETKEGVRKTIARPKVLYIPARELREIDDVIRITIDFSPKMLDARDGNLLN